LEQSKIQNPKSKINVVFIHGAGSNADFWYEQRAAFPNAHYLDLPGHMSRSGKYPTHDIEQSKIQTPASEYPKSKIDSYANFVAEYIEREGLDGVVLNGHSMGGAITLTLALRRPSWLKAIVLTGTGARLRVLSRLLEFLREDYPAAVDLILEESFVPPQGKPTYAQRSLLNGTRRHMLRTPQEVTLADYEACDRFDLMEQVGLINVPALCIVGAQDQMTPPRYSEYLHSRIRGSRLEIIEGAGHMLPLERASEYNERVEGFLLREL